MNFILCVVLGIVWSELCYWQKHRQIPLCIVLGIVWNGLCHWREHRQKKQAKICYDESEYGGPIDPEDSLNGEGYR